MPFQAGYDKGAFVDGVPAFITGWSDEDMTDLLDVTHSGTEGEQALIAGVHRPSGSMTLNFNSDSALTAMGVRSGTRVTVIVATGGAPISRQVRVEKVGTKSQVNGVVSVEISYKGSVT